MTDQPGQGWATSSPAQPPPLPTAPDGLFPPRDPAGTAAPPAADPDRGRPEPPEHRPRRRVGLAMFAAMASVALIAGLIGGAAGSWLINRAEQPAAQSAGQATVRPVQRPTSTAAITRPPDSVAGIAAAVLPSVVQIEVMTGQGQGSGSGFILDDQNHILTNSHVVAQAVSGGAITIVFEDGSKKGAKLVGRDAAYDLAVLEADTGSRPPLELGDSDQVVVGDPVIAIGAPLGLQGTVTTGIVSAVNRPVSAGVQNRNDPATFINAIQTDAAINPGNSGGPLVDLQGRVIGINSAIAQASTGPLGSGASGNIGLGFAVPSNQARRTADALITTGVAEYPVIGVSLTSDYQGEGVKVADQTLDGSPPVSPDGPADKAGIKPGDVIVALDGRPMTSALELIVAVRSKAVGDTVTLTVRRGGRDVDIPVTLAAAPR